MTSERNPIIITTSRGLDELLQQEIQQLVPDSMPRLKPGQVLLDASLKEAYTICLHSRLANRVLWVVAEGEADNTEQLYQTALTVDWRDHMSSSHRFVVNFSGTNRAINNSQFGAQRIKDAIVDCFVNNHLERPNVDKLTPDIFIQARLWRDKVVLAIDLSGKSLHQRGYRSEAGEAPLKEHVACALLKRSGWAANTEKLLIDPMCGSGTIAIEAAQMLANIPAGLNRKVWGFANWRGHQIDVWNSLIKQAEQNICIPTTKIIANDNQIELINIAKRNADIAGVYDYIEFSRQDALKLIPPKDIAEGYLVSNPPYGDRLSDLASLVPFFQSLGVHLKQSYADWHVSLLTSQRDLFRQMKLRANNEYGLMNGKLECKLVNFVIDEQNRQVRENASTSEFANRLKKNIKQLQRSLKSVSTNAYRIYDADLPDYNVAIDVYGDWLVVQEYAPPKTIPEQKARRRLNDVVIQLPSITDFDPKKIAVKVRSQQKGKAQYQKVSDQSNNIIVHENGAQFYINPTDYLDCGLFLDHRITRQVVAKRAKNKDVLNLFAYTGSVSVHCALQGARSITTVDLSKTYIDWAKRNFKLNQLSGAYHFQQADCLTWFETHSASFDLMFIDPPSFSNSKRMASTWDVQRDHIKMLSQAYNHLNQDGEIIFSTNLRQFKMDVEAARAIGFKLDNISSQTLPDDFKRNPKIHQCWFLKK